MKVLAWAAAAALGVWVAGLSLARADAPTTTAVPRAAVAFVVDGSGDQDYLSGTLGRLAREGMPVQVERIAWSRPGLAALDLHDGAAQDSAACRLAGAIFTACRADPNLRICLVGHSAGARIVLAAAEALPPGSVDRIVLLAPAVSRHYDLSGALAASREGIDSYSSSTDLTLLAVELLCLTADGRKARTAGRLGFLSPGCPNAAPAGLRQHTYEAWMRDFGHWGGHYGWTRPEFVRHILVPLLSPDTTDDVQRSGDRGLRESDR